MNQFLAEFYQTGGGVTKEASEAQITDVDALEKMAQLTLLVKQAEDEGVDISNLSDEEALQLADEMYGGEADDQGEQNESDESDEVEKEAQAKFEEADFLGRVMAHANWQETQEILKEAGVRDKVVGAANATGRFLRDKVYGKTLGAVGSRAEKAVSKSVRKGGHGKTVKGLISRLGGGKGQRTGNAYREGGKRLARGANIAAQVGTGAAGAAALGGAGYGGYKGVQAIRGREKKSALDTLIEQRAIEHLASAGYVDQQGNVYAPVEQEQEKTAGDFQAQIDQAALELLEQNGYTVEWNR